MCRGKMILIAVLGVLLSCGGAGVYAAQAESNTKTRKVSGEITWIDVKLGKLHLKTDAGQTTSGTTEYRINQDQTRVTDSTDKKFLVIKDLQAGQHVTLELLDIPGDTLVRKIIAEPVVEPAVQEVTGVLEAIDVQAGTFSLAEEPLPAEGEKRNPSYFVFEPKTIVAMRSPSMEPIALELKPGDLVKVVFVVKDGKRHASSITLLSPAAGTTSTTTTTTTSTTVTR